MENKEFENKDPDQVDDFLRKKMMEAADRYEEELNSDPSLEGLEPSPRVFENIMAIIEKEETAAARAEDLLSEEDRRALELGRKQLAHPARRRVLRVLGVAAAVLVGIFGASMSSEANRVKLVQTLNVLIGNEGAMRLNNEESNEIVSAKEQEAWAEIKEKLGIGTIGFKYVPDGMEYESYELDETVGMATMTYQYQNTILYIRMENRKNKSSQGEMRDGKVLEDIKVKSDAGEITVLEIQGENEKDYLAEFEYENAYYVIYGIMPKEEFVQMIEKLFIF